MSKSLLPINATGQERAVESAIERSAGVETPIRELWRPGDIPEGLLPWLAWALSVDFWDSAWPADVKRAVIRNSVQVHRVKGTRRAVEMVLEMLGVSGAVTEWFEYGGRPYFFRVVIDVDATGIVTPELSSRVVQAVWEYKNTRSWLDAIVNGCRSEGCITVGVGAANAVLDRAVCPDGVTDDAVGEFRGGMGAVGAVLDWAVGPAGVIDDAVGDIRGGMGSVGAVTDFGRMHGPATETGLGAILAGAAGTSAVKDFAMVQEEI